MKKRNVGSDAQFTENMKDDGQSRKEAINLMTDPISSKESCRIGTWNVRTMNEKECPKGLNIEPRWLEPPVEARNRKKKT